MFMTFAELERAAYIRGRTYLAKAYAAADDANSAALKDADETDILDAVKKSLEAAQANLEAAVKQAEENRTEARDNLQLGLDI